MEYSIQLNNGDCLVHNILLCYIATAMKCSVLPLIGKNHHSSAAWQYTLMYDFAWPMKCFLGEFVPCGSLLNA